MAIISADTFRPLKRHIGCRLQQGVPIVDADWNELEDIRRFELRAFLKWFIGDGIPEGTDGFRVAGQNQPNDFLISAGTPPPVQSPDPVEHALRDIGRLLVDGRDILIDADLRYRQQPLHVSQPGATARAAALGVPTVPELPVLNGEVLVYVDLWDRLLTPAEDPSLLFPGLGTESCARLKREWVVRARVSTTAPSTPADPDYLAGHSYYALARVRRRTTSPNVVGTDVVDLRARRLFLPPATLIEDALGTTADRYRLGLDRPAINLRAAINALLRGELPGTQETALAPGPAQQIMMRGFAFDRSNGLLAAWLSPLVGSDYQVFMSRLSLGNIPGGFDPVPVQVTTTTSHPYPPFLAVLPDGDVIVSYSEVTGTSPFEINALFKRAPYSALATAPEQQVANTPQFEAAPMVHVSGNVAVFIYAAGTNTELLWKFRRLRHTDNTWLDASPVVLSPEQVEGYLHTAVAEDGRLWVLASSQSDKVYGLSLDPATGVISNNSPMFDASTGDPQPFILPTKAGPVFGFWRSPTGLMMTRFAAGVWEPAQALPFTLTEDQNPTAVEDASGGLWLYFARGTPRRVYYVRREPADGRWGLVRQLTVQSDSASDDENPFALQAPDYSAWVFWQSVRNGGAQNIFYKQVFNSI